MYLQFDEKLHSLQMHKTRRKCCLYTPSSGQWPASRGEALEGGIKSDSTKLTWQTGAPLLKAVSIVVTTSFLPQSEIIWKIGNVKTMWKDMTAERIPGKSITWGDKMPFFAWVSGQWDHSALLVPVCGNTYIHNFSWNKI